jgi:hypothetical protein
MKQLTEYGRESVVAIEDLLMEVNFSLLNLIGTKLKFNGICMPQ